MKKLLKISMLIAFLAFHATNSEAQKFGHVNSGNILAQMPGTQTADEALKVYQDSLVKAAEVVAAAVRTDFEAFVKQYNAGELTPAVSQQKQAEFQQKEQELIQQEQVITNMINQKRQELINPLVVKLKEAIDAIGKEEGYTMIFDTSVFNAVLFAQESEDISAKIKAKLSIQ